MKAAGIVALVLLAGCGDKKKEAVGVKSSTRQWTVTATTLKDTREPTPEGRCLPADLTKDRKGTWCTALNPIGVKGMTANIDLYFAGTEPTAPIAELQLRAGACQEEELSAWLGTNFGKSAARVGNQERWENPNLLIAAFLPLMDEPGTCLVRMFPRREQALYDAAIAPR